MNKGRELWIRKKHKNEKHRRLFNLITFVTQYFKLKTPPMRKDKVIQIFVDIDDFVKDLDQFAMKKQLLGSQIKGRIRKSHLSRSERMIIYVCFLLELIDILSGF